MTPAAAVEFLNEAARYFERRDTQGEDRAFWSNAYNAQNCRQIAALISKTSPSSEGEAVAALQNPPEATS